jgi:signal transduction histidine kinase
VADRGPNARSHARVSLRSRLALLFVASAVVVIAVATVSTVSVVNLLHTRQTLLGHVDPANLEADQLLVAYLNQETGVRGYILSADEALLDPYVQGLAQERQTSTSLDRLLSSQPRLLTSLQRAERQGALWQKQFATPAVAATRAGNPAYTSNAALLGGKALFDAVRLRFDTVDADFVTSRSALGASLNSATVTLVASLIALLVLLVAIGVVVSRALRVWVTAPLVQLGHDAGQVTSGQLDHRIEPTGPPELQQLGTDVEAMRTRIVEELQTADVARRLLAERNDDLTRSNAELEQFAYVASHDLQEPLRKVASFTQLLQQRYGSQLDDRADQYIDFAVDGAKRMQLLINDLLAFSRVGRTTDQFRPVDLQESVDAALSNLATLLDETGATVQIGTLPTLVGDPGLLVALWQNLVANAIKFRSEEVPAVTIDAAPRADEWLFSVSDNGIGIEPRFAEKVFVIFQRLHSREEYEGTGIGLSLCKKIVEFHGGRIWLDTDFGPGARLCFTLPATQEEA